MLLMSQDGEKKTTSRSGAEGFHGWDLGCSLCCLRLGVLEGSCKDHRLLLPSSPLSVHG